MCPGTKPRSRGAFLAVCGLWFVMTPPHSSLSLIVQMCNLHSNQPWIPLTHQTVSRPCNLSRLSCLLLGCRTLPLGANPVAPPGNSHWLYELLRAATPSPLSEPIWFLKTTFSHNLQHFLTRLTLRIMNVIILNSRIVVAQRGNNNFKATCDP